MISKEETIHNLKTALSTEWLAYIEYNILSDYAKGPQLKDLISDLKLIDKDEYEHIEKLNKRIKQLDSNIIIDPRMWFKYSPDSFIVPSNQDTMDIASIILELEESAIKLYTKILELDLDPTTKYVVHHILNDEEEHRSIIKRFIDSF